MPLRYCPAGHRKRRFRADRKYSPDVLRKDYQVFRGTLEAWHPSLYWYTPRDSMDHYFARGYAALKDSMTEPQFRKVLSYVIAQVRLWSYLGQRLEGLCPVSGYGEAAGSSR